MTVTAPLPPAAATDSVVLESEKVHSVVETAPACVTLNSIPAIVSVAVRGAELVLGLAVNRTSARPLPVLPDVTSSQDSGLCAVHWQPPGAMTSTDPDPPADPMAALDADSEN